MAVGADGYASPLGAMAHVQGDADERGVVSEVGQQVIARRTLGAIGHDILAIANIERQAGKVRRDVSRVDRYEITACRYGGRPSEPRNILGFHVADRIHVTATRASAVSAGDVDGVHRRGGHQAFMAQGVEAKVFAATCW